MRIYKVLILAVILAIGCKSAQTENEKPVVIYAIGDSTMADKENPEVNPEHGWGQVLPSFFNANVTIKNHAVNGRSTRSFINEKRWDSVYNKLQKGDYVFIQFGHNDQKDNDPKRYTNPYTTYRNNLIRFVEEARSKEAIPVLFTSIVRRNFNENGTLVDTHGAYPLVVRLVAQEYNVPLVDAQYITEQLEEIYGVEPSKKLHLHFLPGEVSYYPEGKDDNTHLSKLGATEVAKRIVKELGQKVPALQDFMTKENE